MSVTYKVYRNGTVVASDLLTPTYTDTNLTPETEYEYRVSMVTNQGESPLSGEILVSTLAETPSTNTPVSSVELDKATATVAIGNTTKLKTTTIPSTATDNQVNYSSDDNSIASVDNDG